MRWACFAVIALFVLAILVFALQNREVVTMSFLSVQARAPLALLTIVVYLLEAPAAACWRFCGDPTGVRDGASRRRPWSMIRTRRWLRVVLKLTSAKRLRVDDPQSRTWSAMANAIPSR